MKTSTQNKTTGKEIISGREVVFCWENPDGEVPKVISVNLQIIKDGKAERIEGKYSLEENAFLTMQMFNIPLAENVAVATGITTAIETIVSSLKTPA